MGIDRGPWRRANSAPRTATGDERYARSGPWIHFSYYRFPFRGAVCARALPAADFEARLVLPSRRVFEAALAAALDVCFAGAFLCESALPAVFFDFAPVEVDRSVFDAFDAAALPVTFRFVAIVTLWDR